MTDELQLLDLVEDLVVYPPLMKEFHDVLDLIPVGIQAGLLVDTTDSFVYNPVGDTIGTITNIPRPTGETRALNVNNKMWVMGGGRTAPNPSNEVDIYDPVAGTWSIGTPFATARRNFPTDTDGCRIWLAGGYAPTTVVVGA